MSDSIRFPRWTVIFILLAAVGLLMNCNWAFQVPPTATPQITYILITATPFPTSTHTADFVVTPPVSQVEIEFCNDPQVLAAVEGFMNAMRSQNGEELAYWVHPEKGLVIRHDWWNPEVAFSQIETASLFSNPQQYNWGIQDGSGLPISGTFQEIVLPGLLDVFNREYTRQCNTLEYGLATGNTTGKPQIPTEFTGEGYFALYRPAPAGVEMDWRTWAVGVEYGADGLPYISYLVQYRWEI